MRLGTAIGGVALLCAVACHGAPFSGQITGSWGDVATSGCYINLDHSSTCVDNSLTAVFSVSGPTNNVIQWGLGNFSRVTFTGNTLSNVPEDTPIVLGTIEYSNGASPVSTMVFGATLHVVLQGDPTVNPLDVVVGFVSTVNSNTCDPCDADFITTSLGKTLNVFEGGVGTFQVIGKIVGDQQIVTDVQLDPKNTGGFISNGQPSPVPEPSTLGLGAMAALGLAVGGWRRRRA